MERVPEIASQSRLDLATDPAIRNSPESFREHFDLAQVPAAPGCYIMRDGGGAVMYVGKARQLRSRIRSYINEQDERFRVKFLMKRVARIDFLVTMTDKEAVLLENSLIKEHKPRYNVQLKDDKTYVSLKLNVDHAYPRLTVTRKVRKDGAKYYGPYASANAVRETLRHLQRVFPLRTCSDSVLNNRSRPCLYYQMGQCVAPCVGYSDEAAYGELVEQVQLAVEGRSKELKERLRRQIQAHAEALEFEKAAVLRDRLHAMEHTFERQRTVSAAGGRQMDVFGIYHHGRYSEFQVLFFRDGKLLGGRSFTFRLNDMPAEEALSSVMLQYYSEGALIPDEILVPFPSEDWDTLADILSEHRGGKTAIHHPQRGDKRALVSMAARNAQSSFEEKRLAAQANQDLLEEVRKALRLPRAPRRIECFDISTIQGSGAVGAMAVFEGGKPNKKLYRHYTIRDVEGQDDFGMMREVLMRRYKRAIGEGDLPDLLLVDGGKGQLGVAEAVLADLGLEDLPAAGIAKARAQESGGHSPERFFVPGRMNPIVLKQHSPVVHLLARIRDEAHRFANTHHRKRRGKATVSTRLTGIPGVGPLRAKRLLSTFGSVANLRQASVDAIAQVNGVSHALAEKVKHHLAGAADNAGARKSG